MRKFVLVLVKYLFTSSINLLTADTPRRPFIPEAYLWVETGRRISKHLASWQFNANATQAVSNDHLKKPRMLVRFSLGGRTGSGGSIFLIAGRCVRTWCCKVFARFILPVTRRDSLEGFFSGTSRHEAVALSFSFMIEAES